MSESNSGNSSPIIPSSQEQRVSNENNDIQVFDPFADFERSVDEDLSNKLNVTTLSASNEQEDNEKSDDSTEDEIKIPQRQIPTAAVQEKIVIVFDTAQDESCTNFILNDGTTYPPIAMLKRIVEIFLHNKHLINNNHQFALIILNQNKAVWKCNFTNKIHEIIQAVKPLKECDTEDVFNLNTLFDLILKHVTLPNVEDISVEPAYVVRIVLLYSRSYTLPKVKMGEKINSFLQSPYFTFDVLYTHEPLNSTNNCTEIAKLLQNLDKKGYAYFFPVERNMSELHVAMGKLLAHPLQRPTQKQANYSLPKY